MKTFAAALTLLLVSTSVSAKVYSPLTSEELFVCNVGLAHPAGPNPNGTNHAIVGYEDLSMPVDSEARFRTDNLVVAPGTGALSFVTDQEVWLQNIVSTSFDFATENYGAQYYVDICYRGPLARKQGNKDLSEGIYSLSFSARMAGATNDNYQADARLSASVDVRCDLRQKGSLKFPRVYTEVAPAQNETDQWIQSGSVSFQGQQLQMAVPLNNQIQEVPRFCRMRFLIKENASTVARPNKQAPKDVELFIQIEK